jgi:acyl-homoserine-lactone acylase
MFVTRLTLLLIASLAASPTRADQPASLTRPTPTDRVDVQIRRTSFGVPHVLATNYVALGYGLGYAYAQDSACEIARQWVRLNAELSRVFGEADDNVASDFFWQRIKDDDIIGKELAKAPPLGPYQEIRDLVRGYAAGYNRYLKEVGGVLPDPRCQGAGWIRSITERDVWGQALSWAMISHVEPFIGRIVTAAPPVAGETPLQPGQDVGAAEATADDGPSSNSIALGGRATETGRGMFMANPHYSWFGPRRFYEAHLTIPRTLNVSGMTYQFPIISTGHNEHVAWGRTVSTPVGNTTYRLQLVPGSPTSYVFEGRTLRMQPTRVAIQVKGADGQLRTRHHTFWDTRFGPVIESPSLPWTETTAYALRFKDMNLRWPNQELLQAHARSVGDVYRAAATTLGWGWLTTTSADSSGRTYFGEVQSVPHITNGKLADCRVQGEIFDGTRAACDWGSDKDAVEPGLLGVSRLPYLIRDDYATNSNNSHWTSNLRQKLEGYPSILGPERTARSLRTRMGLRKLEGRLNGTDGAPGNRFSLDRFLQIAMNNEVMAGVLWQSDLVALCRSMPASDNVAGACPVLARWDLTENLDSKGAVLFRRFVERSGTADARFTVPFDPADPLHTPRGLNTSDPAVRQALIDAVADLRSSSIPLDATLRHYQFAVKGGERIPIPGGPSGPGQFTAQNNFGWKPGVGWEVGNSGSSFIMFVQFTAEGPAGRSVLTYSQSTNPTSPHFADQTRLFSEGNWKEIRFTEPQILSDPQLSVTRLCAMGGRGRMVIREVPCDARPAPMARRQ